MEDQILIFNSFLINKLLSNKKYRKKGTTIWDMYYANEK